MPDPLSQPIAMDEDEFYKLHPFLPPSPYKNVDFDIVKKHPNQIIAIYENGDGIIFDSDGKPIHADDESTLEKLIKEHHPQFVDNWTYIPRPRPENVLDYP